MWGKSQVQEILTECFGQNLICPCHDCLQLHGICRWRTSIATCSRRFVQKHPRRCFKVICFPESNQVTLTKFITDALEDHFYSDRNNVYWKLLVLYFSSTFDIVFDSRIKNWRKMYSQEFNITNKNTIGQFIV